MNPEEMRAMIAKELALEGLTPEQQEQIIDQFSQNALKRVTLALYERLPEAGKAKFAELGEKGHSQGLLKLFQENIPDVDAVVRGEVQDEIKAFKDFQQAAG